MRIGLIAAAVFNALLLVATNSHAVGGGGGGGGGGGAAPTPSRAPIGAPPTANSNEINSSYEFRNRMSSDPACQELARQTDAAYTNPSLTEEKKKETLDQIRARAKSTGCTN